MVTLRKCDGKENIWEVDIRILLPDGSKLRERREAPVAGKTAALRWAQERERVLLKEGKPNRQSLTTKEVPTLKEFAPRFLEAYVKANQHKPSGIAAKEAILRLHLLPRFGTRRLDEITTEDVQRLKATLVKKSGMVGMPSLVAVAAMSRAGSMPCTRMPSFLKALSSDPSLLPISTTRLSFGMASDETTD